MVFLLKNGGSMLNYQRAAIWNSTGNPVANEVMQGFSARGAGRVALVLLNLCHPEDEEGDYHEAGWMEGSSKVVI